MRILVGLVVALALVLAPPWAGVVSAQVRAPDGEIPHIILFTHVTCPYCAHAKTYVEELASRKPGLTVWVRELSEDRQGLSDLTQIARQVGVRSPSVPAWVIGGQVFLTGFAGPASTGRQIEGILTELGLPEPAPPDGR